jgi:23S rRNA (cytidine1920-2'-O)/16S rRNA (cytidine1409-2'-O)-methyltransferase
VKRVRIDSLLSQRGMFPSRSQAAASVMAGDVLLGPGRRRASKPGELVPEDVELELVRAPQFVSRGGIKLDRALDVGASTGGFTDCLLQRGATQVIAVDVGYGELDWRLRSDPRVTVLERVNARSLERSSLPFGPEVITVDVSFISLRKVLPAVLACAAERFDCLALIKPQFEAGRESVGKGGVVRAPEVRRSTLIDVGDAVRALGFAVLGYASSGLPGPKGNRETFVWVAEAARVGVEDLVSAAADVEPIP